VTVYLDHAASTPVDPQVASAMSELLKETGLQANAASGHAAGRAAFERVEVARGEVAALINARAEEIIWTSGATESNNLALFGAARFRASRGRHLVSCVTEHASVLEPLRQLQRQGFTVTRLVPDADGILDPASVAAAIRADTTLVSVMQVNNETGVIQDIASIGAICRSREVLLHVDAVQACGRERIDVRAFNADLLSLSAHKMYGPKGAGALFIDAERVRRVEPLHFGGGQERGLRPGTLATHQVVGMGVAARLARERLDADRACIGALREKLWNELRRLPGVLLNGHATRRACHILNVSVDGVQGESLHFALRALAVSAGSTCAADGEPSAVLRHLGRSDELARSSVRFSLGRTNTRADVEFAVAEFAAALAHLRRLSPASAA
jgi:cysteine desulfurase